MSTRYTEIHDGFARLFDDGTVQHYDNGLHQWRPGWGVWGTRTCLGEDYDVLQTWRKQKAEAETKGPEINEYRYYDAQDGYQTVQYTEMESQAGYVEGPEYKVALKLLDGRWLTLSRHQDRGDLATGARYIKRKPSWAN